jgi:hypothetical protein
LNPRWRPWVRRSQSCEALPIKAGETAFSKIHLYRNGEFSVFINSMAAGDTAPAAATITVISGHSLKGTGPGPPACTSKR